jgi:hypothetical protein
LGGVQHQFGAARIDHGVDRGGGAGKLATSGGQLKYSDRAIECLLSLKAVFHLPYRQTEGFGKSLMELLAVNGPIPDYTTLCIRSADLKVALSPGQVQGPNIRCISTGLQTPHLAQAAPECE